VAAFGGLPQFDNEKNREHPNLCRSEAKVLCERAAGSQREQIIADWQNVLWSEAGF
jgi:hypothetical protein